MNDDLIARLVLASLYEMGPARHRWLLEAAPPEEVVEWLRRERVPPEVGPPPQGMSTKLLHQWAEKIRQVDPAALTAQATGTGVELIGPDHPHWPYTDDPEPPLLLFARGDLSILAAAQPGSGPPIVVIVGTRRCSTIGRQVAYELGAELSEHGVIVASGLAAGIDGAAHRGALAAGGCPLGIVGSGLDVPYPAANRKLWAEVGRRGLLISETMTDRRPQRWRFPARNRLMAGVADAVVIVESHEHGGSLHTVNEALDRGRLVLAVPGAVTNPAAAGSNRLLVEGCGPARGADDVLAAIGYSPPGAELPEANQQVLVDEGSLSAPRSPTPPSVSPLASSIMAEVRAGSTHLDDLIAVTRSTIPELLTEVGSLVDQGVIQIDGSTVSLRASR